MVPEGWSIVSVKDIARVSSGGTPSRSVARYWNGDIPWVTTGEIAFNRIKDTEQKITKEGLENSSAKIFPNGTILLAMYGQGKTRGQVAKLEIDAATNQACAAILINANHEPDFFYHYFVSKYISIRNIGNASTQKNLNAGLIKAFKVLLPPYKEQKKIAQILSTWDKAIETVEAMIENSKAQKKALMQQLLTGQKRFSEFKEDWCEAYLKDYFARITTRNTEHNDNVVTISAQHGLVKQETFFKKRVASETLDNYFLIKRGQFAYNKSYSNGYPMGAIKRLNLHEKGVVTTLYICFDIKNPAKGSAKFFEHYFEAGMLNHGLTRIAHEGGRAHGLLNVTPRDFFNLKIVVPDVNEQRKIAAVIDNAHQQIKLLEQKLAALQREKRSLMQQLLTGKRRVKIAGEAA